MFFFFLKYKSVYLLQFNFPFFRETEEKTYSSQRETCRRISERLNDIAFWRNELTTELERMLSETHLLQDARRSLEKTKQDCDPPLHIALDCMYFREARQGKKN